MHWHAPAMMFPIQALAYGVLIFLRFALRAFALAGRLPWLAFFVLRPGLAMVLSSGELDCLLSSKLYSNYG